ncbi:MAG TPA: EAL domain-containing protein [Solirubrobacteraceae bacterium]|jgi:diguanylate cyclase (GGDEF)-like protein|nr:EAL domain-containing protein [Solirubrobacteraceae bacterium]
MIAPVPRQVGASVGAALTFVAWGSFAVHAGFVTFGLGRGLLPDAFFVDVVHNTTYVCATAMCLLGARRSGRNRGAILALGTGMLLWSAANVSWTIFVRPLEDAPWPSMADAGWLAFYPAAYFGLVRLVGNSVGSVRPTLLLDGLITALAVAALATVFIMGPVISERPDESLGAAVTVAYPVGDIILLSLVAGALTVMGRHGSGAWRLIGAGLALFALGDAIYAHISATSSYESGTPLDLTWAAGMVLMAHASRRAAGLRAHQPTQGKAAVVLPLAGALSAIGLLIYGNHAEIGRGAILLAALALIAAAGRMLLTIREVRGLVRTEHEARTDALTGLPNRRAFYEHLAERIRAAGPHDRFAVLVLDMDGFKEINDTLGHPAGDSLLCEAGARLQRSLRRGDVVYRLGGDEFGAVLSNVTAADQATRVADRLDEAMHNPFAVEGISLAMHLSAGIALFPAHGADAESLFRHADVAMYQAKHDGSRLEVYSHSRDPNKPERLRLLADLQRALHADELLLHYQPKVDLAGVLQGVEALVRWRHPSGDLIPPGAFVPLAERTGLMAPLTDVVLDKALDQLVRWDQEGFRTQVAVNIAPNSLLDAGLAATLSEKLAARGLSGSSLRLEFTETAVMSDPERAGATLAELRSLGIAMSLDDFGTGHSSLAHLKHLVVDELKIDRSFVKNVHHDAGDAAIVRSTIDLARRLGLTVVAEGVETVECQRALRSYGCLLMQGYLIGRPMPGDEIALWLSDWRASSASWDSRAAA